MFAAQVTDGSADSSVIAFRATACKENFTRVSI